MQITSPDEKIIAAISERSDGSMRLHSLPDIDQNVWQNRETFLKNIISAPGIEFVRASEAEAEPNVSLLDKLVSPSLQHSGYVARISNGSEFLGRANAGKLKCDGLVTKVPGILLSVTAGDCPPLFIHDPKTKSIGIAHCGWKPLRDNIVENLVNEMRHDFYSNPADLIAFVGPSIGPCHYEVKKDVSSHFGQYRALSHIDGKDFLWLNKIILTKLWHLGFSSDHIHLNHDCTYCARLPEEKFDDGPDFVTRQPNYKYFSARRDKNLTLETMMAVIGLKDIREKESKFINGFGKK